MTHRPAPAPLLVLLATQLGVLGSSAGCATPASPPPPPVEWTLVPQESGVDASLRGLSVVDADVAWASGSGGTWLRTVDGGHAWEHGVVAGAEALDFRDVHAFDANRAVLVSAGAPARIYRTEDGGRSFTLCHEDLRPEVFFDALDFWDDEHGIGFSDPVGGRLVVVRTEDGGRTWQTVPEPALPPALAGEAGFAASGTCLTTGPDGRTVWIGLGGATDAPGARLLRSDDRGRSWSVMHTPLPSSASAGIFSIDFRDSRFGVLVGGDYLAEEAADSNALYTQDGGATWQPFAGSAPGGYRSVVAFAPGVGEALSAGPTGIDRLTDASWEPLFEDGGNALDFAPQVSRRPANGSVKVAVGWCVGATGRIARIEASRPQGNP